MTQSGSYPGRHAKNYSLISYKYEIKSHGSMHRTKCAKSFEMKHIMPGRVYFETIRSRHSNPNYLTLVQNCFSRWLISPFSAKFMFVVYFPQRTFAPHSSPSSSCMPQSTMWLSTQTTVSRVYQETKKMPEDEFADTCKNIIAWEKKKKKFPFFCFEGKCT